MSGELAYRRAKRSTRLWLFAPATLLALVLLASAGGWLFGRQRLVSEMDRRADALRAAGWTATWTDRTISGFPFRLKTVLTDLRLQAPGEGGWGVSAPALEAEAYVVFPTHWVFVAPGGLTVMRPAGGPLQITGEALRASLAGVETAPPRIALEGVNLTFAPGPDAKPFSFATLKHAELHLRPSADRSGDADWLATLHGGAAPPQGLLSKLAPGGNIDIAASGRLTKLAAAQGGSWSDRVQAWSAAGGAMRVDRLAGVSGPLHVDGSGGLLGADADGRLEGSIPLSIAEPPEAAPAAGPRESPAAVAAMAARSGSAVALPVAFKDGRMRFGPLDVGPAPRLR